MSKETPILFSAPMVRAILDGRKTQTRRVLTRKTCFHDGNPAQKWQWDALDFKTGFVDRGPSPAGNSGPYIHITDLDGDCTHRIYPRWLVGEGLWVRETWYNDLPDAKDLEHIYYRADGECCEQIPECACGEVGRPKWRPSIFMPKWASRLSLEVTKVRGERIQDISESDALAEGFSSVSDFKALWDSLNAERGFGWSENPWVWVIEFERGGGAR
jgi:hypothetical protein